jgi:hypothetical protein
MTCTPGSTSFSLELGRLQLHNASVLRVMGDLALALWASLLSEQAMENAVFRVRRYATTILSS